MTARRDANNREHAEGDSRGGRGVIPALGRVTPYLLRANLVLLVCIVLVGFYFITDLIPAQESVLFIRKKSQ